MSKASDRTESNGGRCFTESSGASGEATCRFAGAQLEEPDPCMAHPRMGSPRKETLPVIPGLEAPTQTRLPFGGMMPGCSAEPQVQSGRWLGPVTKHIYNPFIPASDHFLLTQHPVCAHQHKLKGLISLGRNQISFHPQVPHVMHHAGLAALGRLAPGRRSPPALPWCRDSGTLGGLVLQRATWPKN